MNINTLIIKNALAIFLLSMFVCVLEAKPAVLVSVAPHKFFVEKIAGDTLDVILMVPAGASAHTYEPTPKQMITASRADLWFKIGETFEGRAVKSLASHNPKMKVVDLRRDLDVIGVGCCSHHSMDLHFWLSAKLAQTQAENIAKALSIVYPENTNIYKTNLAIFRKELQQLDEQIDQILKPIGNRNILVSHPAYAYFCRDYNLIQSSIEFEGKDPTPQYLTKILTWAKNEHIATIFIQQQYNNKGAKLVADQIGAKIVMLDPYSENYYTSMLQIAHAFAEGCL